MSKVIIEMCENYSQDNVDRAVERIFQELGRIEKFVGRGTRVLVKPNLVMKKRPDQAATTHPSLVKAICKVVQRAGGQAVVADSPGGLYTVKVLKSLYSYCGMEEAVKNTGASLNYDLSEAEAEIVGGKLLKKAVIIKPVAEADLVINLPKLKTHGQMVYTGAVKNLFGTVPGALKLEYHFGMKKYEDFADSLIDIFLAVRPGLTIMDAVTGMDGHGPTAGDPKHLGLILASQDAFALDYTALNIVGAHPDDVPVIRQAILRGMCPPDIGQVEIVGQKLENVRVNDFFMPAVENLRAVEFFDRGAARFFATKLKPKPVFSRSLCIGCSECEKNCPANAIAMYGRKPRVDLNRCIRCFCCQELCPARAITIKRPLVSKLLLMNRKKSK